MDALLLDRSFWTVGIRGTQRRADILQSNVHLVRHRGIDFDPDRRVGSAGREHLTNPRNLGKLLLNNVRSQFVHLRLRINLGDHRQQHDRRVGRIHLAVRRIVRQIRWQLTSSRIDRRLNLSRRRIHVPIQLKLQRDRGVSERAGGCHLGHTRDTAKAPLERSRNRRGHRFRTRPWQ